MRNSNILIVDDEIGIRDLLSEILQDEGYSVLLAENAEEARRIRNQGRPAMVLLDIWMPDCDGITLLKEWAKSGQLNMPVIMMSGHASIDTAVEATKIGAMDFLEKPISLQKLLSTVERALKQRDLQTEPEFRLEKLGSSEPIKQLNNQLERAARTPLHVLLTGESGCPFETVARYFHHPGNPWIEPTHNEQITSAPTELLQKASGGIIYFGDLLQYSRNVQQSIHFMLGKAERYNVRIIGSCSRPLHEVISHGEHDPRLFNQLSSLIIPLPPLRNQADDITFLVQEIVRELREAGQIEDIRFHSAALSALRQYDWPGNFEQLKSVVKSLTLSAEKNEIALEAVQTVLRQFTLNQPSEIIGGFNFDTPLRELREEVERRYFEYHILQEQHNMSRVAQKVGLERTHLYRKLKQLGIQFNRGGK